MLQEIKPNIFSVGASDSDRKLFDSLIPLSNGTTYNSYVVRGSEKTALIDTVDPTKSDVLFANLEKSGITHLDYIIINHAEQDHSGTLPLLAEKFPEAKIICSEKCQPILMSFMNLSENRFQIIKDSEIISLGDKTLEFVYVPWVHWPETMASYIKEDKILFSCDFFGAHLASDNLLDCNKTEHLKATKGYFAEIMMPFRAIIKNNLAKLEKLDIDMVAPSHGPIHIDIKQLLSDYALWSSDTAKNLVVIAYVSMHGSTQIMADRLESSLVENGVEVCKYDVSSIDLSKIATDLLDAATVVVGTPCVLGGIHPAMASVLYLVNALRPKTRFVSVLGSFGWSGGIAEAIVPMIKNLKVEIIEPVIIKGLPKENDFEAIDELASVICSKHREAGLI